MHFASPITAFIVKTTQVCNLNCSYCYMYNHPDKSYKNKPAVMTEQVYAQMLERMNEFCEAGYASSIALTYHGGEPMLMNPARFERLVDMTKTRLGSRLGSLSMQSNATRVTGDWIAVLRKHNIRISVSLDGPEDIHDSVRVDHEGRGSYSRTLDGFRALQDAGLQPGILCVINPGRSGIRAYRHFRSLGITNMDFLIPDVNFDSRPLLYPLPSLTPVADYLIPIFEDWYSEDNPNITVRLFEEVITLLLGGTSKTDAIGARGVASYLVIDSDGAILQSDVLKVCAPGVGDSGLNVMTHGFGDLKRAAPLVYDIVTGAIPLAVKCRMCPESSVCAGGYLPHRYSPRNGFDNPSAWCSDLLALITHIRSRVTSDLRAHCA